MTFDMPLITDQRLAFAFIAVLATGCSGINATKSVSPLDFILPGLLQNCPPPPVNPVKIKSVPLLASAGFVTPAQDKVANRSLITDY